MFAPLSQLVKGLFEMVGVAEHVEAKNAQSLFLNRFINDRSKPVTILRYTKLAHKYDAKSGSHLSGSPEDLSLNTAS